MSSVSRNFLFHFTVCKVLRLVVLRIFLQCGSSEVFQSNFSPVSLKQNSFVTRKDIVPSFLSRSHLIAVSEDSPRCLLLHSHLSISRKIIICESNRNIFSNNDRVSQHGAFFSDSDQSTVCDWEYFYSQSKSSKRILFLQNQS